MNKDIRSNQLCVYLIFFCMLCILVTSRTVHTLHAFIIRDHVIVRIARPLGVGLAMVRHGSLLRSVRAVFCLAHMIWFALYNIDSGILLDVITYKSFNQSSRLIKLQGCDPLMRFWSYNIQFEVALWQHLKRSCLDIIHVLCFRILICTWDGWEEWRHQGAR